MYQSGAREQRISGRGHSTFVSLRPRERGEIVQSLEYEVDGSRRDHGRHSCTRHRISYCDCKLRLQYLDVRQ